jgi:hypothetical protein
VKQVAYSLADLDRGVHFEGGPNLLGHRDGRLLDHLYWYRTSAMNFMLPKFIQLYSVVAYSYYYS